MAIAPEAPVTTPAPPVRLLKIGQLAARSGITARNLRFYADAGVFGDLPRSVKGYRLFPPEAVHWVRILRAAQAAGFSLDEVQELLRALRQDSAPCAHVRGPGRQAVGAGDEACGNPAAGGHPADHPRHARRPEQRTGMQPDGNPSGGGGTVAGPRGTPGLRPIRRQ